MCLALITHDHLSIGGITCVCGGFTWWGFSEFLVLFMFWWRNPCHKADEECSIYKHVCDSSCILAQNYVKFTNFVDLSFFEATIWSFPSAVDCVIIRLVVLWFVLCLLVSMVIIPVMCPGDFCHKLRFKMIVITKIK